MSTEIDYITAKVAANSIVRSFTDHLFSSDAEVRDECGCEAHKRLRSERDAANAEREAATGAALRAAAEGIRKTIRIGLGQHVLKQFFVDEILSLQPATIALRHEIELAEARIDTAQCVVQFWDEGRGDSAEEYQAELESQRVSLVAKLAEAEREGR